jgi:hypothetical protein
MSRGFVIVAENNKTTDYIKCAEALARSMKKVMPECSITLLTNEGAKVRARDFNTIMYLPKLETTDPYKIANDARAYEMSPYDETIKLEADMLIPRSIEHWWDVLTQQDVVISTTIRNFKGEISDVRAYRRFIDDNDLPDVYNAVTYFKKSDTAKQFFEIVKEVADNWADYKAILKCNPQEEVSTDWAYSIACHIIGAEKTTMPTFTEMCMTHMKQFINGLPSGDWTAVLVCEMLPHVLRINTYTQDYPFHYHTKSFADKIESNYV